MWYLNFYAFYYLINKQNIFVKKIWPKTWDFISTKREIIKLKNIVDIRNIQFKKKIFILICKSNFILLR